MNNTDEPAGLANFASTLTQSVNSIRENDVIDRALGSLLSYGIENNRDPELNGKVIESLAHCLNVSDENPITTVEIWEYQRKSVLLWRKPYLANDPSSFECKEGIISIELSTPSKEFVSWFVYVFVVLIG